MVKAAIRLQLIHFLWIIKVTIAQKQLNYEETIHGQSSIRDEDGCICNLQFSFSGFLPLHDYCAICAI